MKTTLDPDQITEYREKGFTLIEEFLTFEELEAWTLTLTKAISARQGSRLPIGRKPGIRHYEQQQPPKFQILRNIYKQTRSLLKSFAGTSGNSQPVRTANRTGWYMEHDNLWMDNSDYRRLVLDERIGKLAADLEGVDGTRLWTDKALFKLPWDNPTVWHADGPYTSFESAQATTIWIALDDVTMRNGCLYFLPGTHRMHGFEAVPLNHKIAGLFKTYPEFAEMEPFVAEMRAGSCSFHNSLLCHAAGPNMTRHPRRAVAMTFIPDGTRYTGKPSYFFTPEQFASMKPGDLLDDEKQNPLVYSSSSELPGL